MRFLHVYKRLQLAAFRKYTLEMISMFLEM